MRRLFNWQVMLGITLVALSAVFYFAHYLIFRDLHHIFIYLLGDIAFVFIEVLMVTMIIHQLLTMREKKALLKKLNMVIGAFFSEVGTPLIKDFCGFDKNPESISKCLMLSNDWDEKTFSAGLRALKIHTCQLDLKKGDIEGLKKFLHEKRGFLLALLENPNLLEHESFTNLLWAVFHLAEELGYRRDLRRLHEKDSEHLAGDIKRVYKLIVTEWLEYMKHLKRDYPYLFSLAMRTNPFNPDAKPEFG